MKLDFYGPVVESAIIEQADIELYLNDSASGYVSYETISLTTDPRPVSPDSDFTYVETITLSVDST